MKRLRALIMAVAVATLCATVTGTYTGSARNVGADQVTLNFASWRTVPGQWPDPTISAFEKANPTIKVNFQALPGDPNAVTQAERVKFLAGAGLDIAAVRPESINSFIKAGYLVDLTHNGLVTQHQYIPNALSGATAAGRVYAIPGSVDAIGVWYNKDLFAKLHLAVPTTWTQFLAVMATIKASGTSPLVNGYRDSWPIEFDAYPFIQALLVKNPHIFADISAGKVKYTDPLWVQTFTDIGAFFKTGYVHPASLSLDGMQASAVFIQQKAAMSIQGEWMANSIGSARFHVGVFPLPLPGLGARRVVPVTVGDYLAVAASSTHQAAAFTFLTYWLTQTSQATMVQTVGGFSPLRGGPTAKSPLMSLWPSLLAMENNNFFYSLQNPSANTVLLKDLQSLYLGQISPQQVATDLQRAQSRNAKT